MSSRYFATVRRVTLNTRSLQHGGDLFVGQRVRGIFFFNHFLNAALQQQQRVPKPPCGPCTASEKK